MRKQSKYGMLDAALRREILEVIAPIPVCKTLGFRVEELGEGTCRMVVPFESSLVGIFGFVHGGILMTIADSAACFAIMTRTGPHRPMVTTDMNIRFLATCKGQVTAIARVLKIGRTLCPVAVDLMDELGNSVAMAQVTYMLLEKPPNVLR